MVYIFIVVNRAIASHYSSDFDSWFKKKNQCMLNSLDRVAAYIPCNSAKTVSTVQMIYVLNNLLQPQNAFVERDGVGGLRKSFLGSAGCFAARYFFAPLL